MSRQRLHENFVVTTIRSREKIEEMREAWESLQGLPNADIDLYLATLDASPEAEPYVVFFWRDGKPLGMLAGQVDSFEFPISIGYKTLFTFRLRGLTVLPGAIQGDLSEEFSETLLDAILQLARDKVDVVRLIDMPLASNLASLAMRRPLWLCRDHVRWSGRHWKIILPDSSDAFFQRLSRKHRRTLQKACELLEHENPEGLSYEVFTRPDQLERFCNDAEQIAQKSYQRQIGASFVNSELTLRKLSILAERRQWRAYIMYVHECPVAYWAGTHYGSTFYTDHTGRDPSYNQFNPGTGTILFMKMMEDLCDNTDVNEVDLGFGDYPYKERFGDEGESTVTLLLFAPTLFGISVNMVRTLFWWVERSASFILEHIGLRSRIKRVWRDRLSRED